MFLSNNQLSPEHPWGQGVARVEEDPTVPPHSLTIWSGVLKLVDIKGL